jgi:hypothetical protein
LQTVELASAGPKNPARFAEKAERAIQHVGALSIAITRRLGWWPSARVDLS